MAFLPNKIGYVNQDLAIEGFVQETEKVCRPCDLFRITNTQTLSSRSFPNLHSEFIVIMFSKPNPAIWRERMGGRLAFFVILLHRDKILFLEIER